MHDIDGEQESKELMMEFRLAAVVRCCFAEAFPEASSSHHASIKVYYSGLCGVID